MHKHYAIALALLVVFAGIPTGAQAQEQEPNSITTQQVTLQKDFTLVSTTTNLVVPTPVATVEAPKAVTKNVVKQFAQEEFAKTFPGESFDQFAYIVEHESNWDPSATNPWSDACGVAQLLPCVGKPGLVAAGVSYKSLSYQEQVKIMFKYIKTRYKTVAKAYGHKRLTGWY